MISRTGKNFPLSDRVFFHKLNDLAQIASYPIGDRTPGRPRSRSNGSDSSSRIAEATNLGLDPEQLKLAESLAAEIPAVTDMSSKFAGATPQKILTSASHLVRYGVASIEALKCINAEGRKYLLRTYASAISCISKKSAYSSACVNTFRLLNKMLMPRTRTSSSRKLTSRSP